MPEGCFAMTSDKQLFDLPGVFDKLRNLGSQFTRDQDFILGAAKFAWFCYAQEPIGHMTLKGEPTCQTSSHVENSNSTGKGSNLDSMASLSTKGKYLVLFSFETTASVSSSDTVGGSASATAGVDGLFFHASATAEGHFDQTDESSQSQSQSGSFDVSYNGDTSTAFTEDTENSITQTFSNETPAGGHCTFTVRTVTCNAKATGSIKIVADGVAWIGASRQDNGALIGFRLSQLPVQDRTIEFPLTSDIHSDSTNADVTNDCTPVDGGEQSSTTGSVKAEGKTEGSGKDDKKGGKKSGKKSDKQDGGKKGGKNSDNTADDKEN
ncbi:hypothetical protein DL96DRAFT_1631766 [Flagelloscypha sp. PMI_526]|nr:hypothetical protein DL96DRAFT_1631766 [Flagelloscypha sp. PMI_526]